MNTTVRRVQLPDGCRILMISDLHGHAAGLRALLRQADFGGTDVLIIVGDLIEKGPESLATLRLVMALCRAHTVYPLMGNVDLWRLERLMSDDAAAQQALLRYSLKARKAWGGSLLEEMCRELGLTMDEGMNTQKVFPQLWGRFAAELAFLAGLPAVLDTQRMVFVHGGLPHDRLDELAGQDCYPLLKRRAFLREGRSFRKWVAVGHWPCALYSRGHPCADPVIDRERHILCLDGGCGVKMDGQLNLVMLPDWRSEAFTLLRWNGLEKITALDAQAEGGGDVYIQWGDQRVTLLARDGDMARVAHHGRILDVPARLLYEEDGATCCDDITDYRPAVAPGEELSLLFTMPQGCYVKRNGDTGWYMGRFRQGSTGT